MPSFLDPPLVARNGRNLKILAVCRISTLHQDERSLADQEASYRSWVAAHTDTPYDMIVLASQGSGEALDRQDYLKAIELVETGSFDLVITEDLGRICRRLHAHLFCETCEDNGTRLIALNDYVDTAREDWRMGSYFAVMRHEAYNKDTSNRIRRSLRNRFQEGSVFQFPLYGYIKPEGAKGDADVSKDPAAEPIYDEWFRRLESGASYAEIADWLNERGIPTGPYCRDKTWTCAMVSRVTHNPILKGVRVRNAKVSRRINKTGHRRSVKAPPEERLERVCPHLAFIGPGRYDRVVRIADRRNAKYRRQGTEGVDQRQGVSKKRTTWPGQHLRCGVCGRIFHWTGVKHKKMMMCSGAATYHCWNSLVLGGELVVRKLTEAILAAIESLPDFDACFLDMVRQKAEEANGRRSGRRQEVQRQLQGLNRQIAQVTDAIAAMGGSRALLEKLRALESEQGQLEEAARELEAAPPAELTLPSAEEIKRAARDVFASFAADSPEVGRLMRTLLPELKVYPYRLCDGGAVEMRAKFTLHLVALTPSIPALSELDGVFRREMVVDLFDPPQRVQYRQQVMSLRDEGKTEREAAAALGITQTAVQRAAALDRLMREKDIGDPYLPVLDPPVDYGKMRRHLHRRYRFEPLSEGD